MSYDAANHDLQNVNNSNGISKSGQLWLFPNAVGTGNARRWASFSAAIGYCIVAGFISNDAGAIAKLQESQTIESSKTQAADSAGSPTSKREKSKSIEHFLRIGKNSRGKSASLQTSVTRYETRNDKGETITVDLIGAVHIGEKAYYEALNEQFKKYDALLYELVAPEGTVIPKGGMESEGILNPVAALQIGMKSMLELEFQLEHVDYTPENFVHADMSPDEFLDSMRKNEESFGKMFLKAMGQSMAMESSSQTSGADLLLAMFSKNPTLSLRKTMAEQMRDMEGGMAIFEGKDGSTIITHRNGKAMEVLRREMDSGKKNLGIFFGAGHLPDMERRLLKDFQMKRGGQFWLNAWNLVE